MPGSSALADPGWLFSLGTFMAGVFGIKGWDRFRGKGSDDDDVVKAIRELGNTIRADGSLTRTAIYKTAETTRGELQAIGTAQARLEGRLSANGRRD